MKYLITIIVCLCIGLFILGMIVKAQTTKLHGLENDLVEARQTVSILELKADQLTSAIYSLDGALQTYIDNQTKAHDEYMARIKAVETDDPVTRMWLAEPLPACVQDAISGAVRDAPIGSPDALPNSYDNPENQ